jgi:hypothetical protein
MTVETNPINVKITTTVFMQTSKKTQITNMNQKLINQQMHQMKNTDV